MNNCTTTISFSIFSNKGVYALLLGSGISRSSGIPTGWDIVVDLIMKLAKLKKEECTPSPEEWFKSKYGEEPNYSNIIAKLVKSPSERVNFLKQYFEPTKEEAEQGLKVPTNTHKYIASLVKKGYVKVIITTNFDRLLEKAFHLEGIEPTVIRHPNDIDGAMPLVHNKLIIVKINGDYLDTRFLNTKDELFDYDKKLQDYILRIVNEFGIISCGWSAKWDIGLINVFRQSENFRFSSYWTYVEQCNSELSEIAKIRKGKIIKINDSDSFFGEIFDKIEALENINDSHPLSSDIAVARLKRYIVKDEYKILLHDLVHDHLTEILLKIRTRDDPGLYPDSSLLPVLSHYINSFTSFLPLIINGVYWAKEEHYYLLTDILVKFSIPPKRPAGSFYEETVNILYFPSLLALYSIGITAIKSNKYALLDQCFRIKIDEKDNEYSELIFLIDKIHPFMVEKKIMNDIISKKYHTPLSTFLCQSLKPNFIMNNFSDKEFDDTFDVFEYFLSLYYLYLVEPKLQNNWTPIGQYHWRNNYLSGGRPSLLTTMLMEAEKLKQQWLPIEEGMFDGKYENFEIINLKLKEFRKNIFWH